jgi:MFS family permease
MQYLRSWIGFLLTSMFLCYEMALQVSPGVITQQLMHDYHIDAAMLAWTASSYFITYTLMQIPAGLVFDRFNLKTVVCIACFFCALGLWLFTLPNVLSLVLGRMLMGAGSAFAFISVLTIAAHGLPKKLFALLVGLTQMLAAVGAGLGESPLAFWLSSRSWQDGLQTIALFGAALGLLMFFLVVDPRKKVVKKSASVTLMQLKAIVKNKYNALLAGYAFFNWAPVMVLAALWGVPFLVRLGITTQQAAKYVMDIWIGIAFTAPVLGYLVARYQHTFRFMQALAFLGACASLGLLCLNAGYATWMIHLIFLVLGMASTAQILTFALLKEYNPLDRASTVIAFVNMAVVAGGVVFQPMVGSCLQWLWDGRMVNAVPQYTVLSYQIAFLVLPICFLICIILASLAKKHHQKT